MASPVYVWDGSSQDDSDATWNSSTIAYLTLQAALATVDAGGIVYIASEHNQTQATDLTLASANGTSSQPVKIISVDKDNSDAYLPMIDDASPGYIEVTGGTDINFHGWDIYQGVTGKMGDNWQSQAQNDINVICEDCTWEIENRIIIGTGDASVNVIWKNCDLIFTAGGEFNTDGGSFSWFGGSVTFNGGSVTTNLFQLPTARPTKLLIVGVDFQDLDSGDYIVGTVGSNTMCDVLISGCKVPSALGGLITGSITGENNRVRFRSVSNSDIIYQFQEEYFNGQIVQDTGIYLDATYDGTNGYSAKMVSNANAEEYHRPLKFELCELWVSATGKVLTVELITTDASAAVALNNDDFWIEVEYPDSTTKALSNILSTRMANPQATPAALASSSKGAGDWTGELTSTNYYKVDLDFTGVADEAVGVYKITAFLARPSTTVYIDPKIAVV